MKTLTLKGNHLPLPMLAIALAMGAASANAQLVDANFYSSGFGGSAASGAGVVGAAGDTWNGINAASSGGPINLVTTTGASTPFTLSYDTAGGGAITSLNQNNQPNPSLMNDYLFNNQGKNITVTLNGLAHSTQYDLWVYVASGDGVGGNRAANVTANLLSAIATGNPESTFIAGDNYVRLDVTSSPTGTIAITESDGIGNTSGEVDMNGLQIEAIPAGVPDNTATFPLFAIAGLGLIAYARRTPPNIVRIS